MNKVLEVYIEKKSGACVSLAKSRNGFCISLLNRLTQDHSDHDALIVLSIYLLEWVPETHLSNSSANNYIKIVRYHTNWEEQNVGHDHL